MQRMKQFLSVEECHLLLRWTEKNDPDLLVYPVLCLFAGLRSEHARTLTRQTDIEPDKPINQDRFSLSI